jgi:hypothetical protein
MSDIAGVVRLLKKEQDRLTKELRGISAALAAFGQANGKQTGTRKISAFGGTTTQTRLAAVWKRCAGALTLWGTALSAR